jgi:hypothetical protein
MHHTSGRSRRELDIPETLRRLEERVRTTLANNIHKDLDGAYLSTFESYSTVESSDVVPPSMEDVAAIRIMLLARELGVNVLGVTSERKRGGQYVCSSLGRAGSEGPRESFRVVYVGTYSYFTGHHVASPYSVRPVDKVYSSSTSTRYPSPRPATRNISRNTEQ